MTAAVSLSMMMSRCIITDACFTGICMSDVCVCLSVRRVWWSSTAKVLSDVTAARGRRSVRYAVVHSAPSAC